MREPSSTRPKSIDLVPLTVLPNQEADMKTLRQLMSAYFHQDWNDEYGTEWRAAVDDFLLREPDRVSALRLELAELLASTTDDATLGARLDALGSYYWPGDAANAHREWVTAVRDHVTSATGGGPA